MVSMRTAAPGVRQVRRAFAAGVVALTGLALGAGAASAEFGIVPGSFRADAYKDQAASVLETQAGAHPFQAATSFEFRGTDNPSGQPFGAPDGNVKHIAVDLPQGFVGNPQAVDECSFSQFQTEDTNPVRVNSCPIDSQVGTVTVDVISDGYPWTYQAPIYNMEPYRNEIAAFGFNVMTVFVRAVPTLRADGSYALRLHVRDISNTVGLMRTQISLWGVPSDPAHDADRSLTRQALFGSEISSIGGNIPSTATPRPFLTNPVDCSAGPFPTVLGVRSWQNPDVELRETAMSSSGVTGCEKLNWEPTLEVKPDNTVAGAPTGLSVTLSVPQNDNPAGLATPELRKAVVRLPEGMRVSPSASDGLGACSDEQIALGTDTEPACPESSNIGTVTIDTPLLRDPLQGRIILGTQKPAQLLRLFLVVRGRGGILIKLPGKVDPDPATGQLTATFDNNPQLPFGSFTLHFKGGSRATLSNPATCGVKTTTTELTAWSAQVAHPSSSFTISKDGAGAPCPPQGFTPSFVAGTDHAKGGAATSFALTFGRDDDDQELRDVMVAMPAGLTGYISQVPLCPDAAANAGACGEESRIGSVMTAAGPGSTPFYLPGRVYLTEGYKGGQFGLSIVVPAVAGPFNLGNVVVRSSIHVDRVNASLRIASDPLPSILMGIPLQVRTVNVNVDRPGFMVNPTSCAPKQVSGTVRSLAGAIAQVASRFQVADCGTLRFKPKMTIRMGARGRTRAGITAPLTVSLRMPTGQANNRSVSVSLPRNVNARLKVINEKACTIDQFKGETCPSANRVGTAVAVTPLLRDPLRGDAYFVRNPMRRIPDLMVALRGQVPIDLTGKVTVNRNLTLRTVFDTIPDVPVSDFTLKLVAGSNGPIGFVANACSKAARAERASLAFRAHSGRLVKVKRRMSIVGCKTRRSAKRAKAKKAGKKASSTKGSAKRK